MAVEVLNFGRFLAKTALAVIIANQRQHTRVIRAMLEMKTHNFRVDGNAPSDNPLEGEE